ncbi:hypothetical protein G7054_g12739 [Neopestalotiopsis clavispora]|nr:hypothetical protein G7054_g12739 [Neopestalotiopsis clavispora]
MEMVSVLEIAKHNREDDIWIAVNGMVYDMTEFAPLHPGGSEIIYRYAGRDASQEYNHAHASTLITHGLEHKFHIGPVDELTITEAWKQSTAGEATGQGQSAASASPLLDDVINLADFESAARQLLSAKSWAFVHGASNDNISRDANVSFLGRIWLRPAVMQDVRTINTESELFGAKLDIPIYIAPTGAAKMAGVEGEIGLAQGASATGIIHCFATPSSYPHGEILAATSQQAFFQLYVDKDRTKSETVIRNVTKTGKVKALFVTVDVPVISKREADERIRSRDLPNSVRQDRKGAGLTRQMSSFIDPSLSWEDIQWLRSITDLPLIIKGIQRSADAKLAMQLGCDGIVVSNHGGRAADTAQPSILTLLELHKNCPEVFGAMKVLIDGGFRRGSDVVKAICLGASAVGLGRPFLYSLSFGQNGVEHLVSVLKDEIETAMRLCGITDLMRDASPEFVNTNELDRIIPSSSHPYAKKICRGNAKL